MTTIRIAVAAGAFAMLSGFAAPGAEAASARSAAEVDVTPSAAARPDGLPASAGATIPEGPNGAVGDVLGRGYEQVIRISGSKVEILEPKTRGGGLIQDFEAGAKLEWPKQPSNLFPVFYGSDELTLRAGHQASRLAVLNGSIYVSSNLTTLGGTNGSTILPNGSIVRKFSAGGELLNERRVGSPANTAITALDAYEFKGHEYLAIGLNKFGIRVVDTNVKDMPDVRVVHDDWNGRNGVWHRDMVTAVKLGVDDEGRFLLISGRFTYEGHAVVATDLEDGSTSGSDRAVHDIWTNNDRPLAAPWQWPNLIEMGPLGPDKKQMVAIGWPTLDHDQKVGRVSFVHAKDGKDWHWTDGTEPVAVRFFTDAEGEPRVAILRGVAVIGGVNASGGWEEVAQIPEEQELPWAVPGYRAWSVTIENRSRDDVKLATYSGSNRWAGCWLDDELHGAGDPLPSGPTSIPSGGTAGPFAAGARTFGEACGADHPGVLYAHVTPNGEPGSAQVLKLFGDEAGLRVDQQVGAGRLTITTERVGGTGVKLIVSDQHAEPTPVGVPTLSASRLTPKPADTYVPTASFDDPIRPVYRFAVSGQNWHVPGADQLSNVTLPVPTVEASTDQVTWTALGTTTSPLAPTRTGTEVALGDSTFYWQTAPGATDYRYFRVVLADGTTSEHLDVAPLPAPAPSTLVRGVNHVGVGVMRPNGLDQGSIQMRLISDTSAALDATVHAALYDRIYFRDEVTQRLITGLGDPAHPSDLVMVTRTPGQFADNAGGTSPAYGHAYVSTGSGRAGQQVAAVFKPDATGYFTHRYPFGVQPIVRSLTPNGVAGSGITLPEACVEGTCELTQPTATRPVLHSSDAQSISLQLKSRAIPGALSLPLTQQDFPAELQELLDDALTYTPTAKPNKATLLHPQYFTQNAATISTQLVSHGELVPADNLFVRPRG